MKQKPSERIEEIAYGLNNDYGVSELLFAIKQYLDEEWEKRQTAFQYREQKADHCCGCVTACGHSTPPSFCENHG